MTGGPMNALILSIYALSITSLLTIAGLSVVTRLRGSQAFWPPPNTHGWQYRSFRWLFRGFFIGLCVLSVTEFGTSFSHPARLLFGVPLLIVGFGLALKWTGFLGWRNAFGEAEGLKTGGAFSWSRNPIYVVSIVGMIGWAFTAGSWLVVSLLSLWTLLYLCAPLLEEPWLAEQYGESFDAYKQQTPRFISPMKLMGTVK